MISKEKFIKAINIIKAYEEYEQKLYDLDIDLADNKRLNSLVSTYVELLAEAANDTDNFVSWWVWETQYGTNEEVNMYWNEGEDVEQPGHTISTPGELYDVITGGDK